jgi:SprT protein
MNIPKPFLKYFPEGAVHFCYQLWKQERFNFKVSKSRKSKFGDFRYKHGETIQTISVNGDLNQYAFLITYLHEVAHHQTYKVHGPRVSPHGQEWKQAFSDLLTQSLQLDVFPQEIMPPLLKYISNPKASTASDPALYAALRAFDNNPHEITLANIPDGAYFLFRQRLFLKVNKRRTRSLCREIETGKEYLISELAPVHLPKD